MEGGRNLCLTCLPENKLNQQVAADRNWMKPPGLRLKSMKSIFILFERHHLLLTSVLFFRTEGEKSEASV